MLVWLTLPFYDFCGFRSVAVNSVYKLHFFAFICNNNVTILHGSQDIATFIVYVTACDLISRQSLNLILLATGNQWSCFSAGVTWSQDEG